MKKIKTNKILSVVLAVVMLLTLIPSMTSRVIAANVVDSGTCGDIYSDITWILDDEGTLTISGTGKMDGYWGDNTPWYDKRTSIKSVVIGNSVTSIGYGAFDGCTSLATVVIGNSVSSFDWSVFNDCTSLTAITVAPGNMVYCSIDVVLFDNRLQKSTIQQGVYIRCKNSRFARPWLRNGGCICR